MPPVNKVGFTEKELLFIKYFAGKQEEAARQAGYKDPKTSAKRLMKKQRIVDAIQKRLDAERTESAKQLAKRVTVTRSEIINGLHKEAQGAESDSARVTAWGKLADIYRLVPKAKDDDPFAGWNDEELDAYINHGILPAWYGLSAEEDDNEHDNGSQENLPLPGGGPLRGEGEREKGARAAAVRAGKPTGRPN